MSRAFDQLVEVGEQAEREQIAALEKVVESEAVTAAASRCPACDREMAREPYALGCHVARVERSYEVHTTARGWVAGQIETRHTLASARAECGTHAVDWRARALGAEQQLAVAIAALRSKP